MFARLVTAARVAGAVLTNGVVLSDSGGVGLPFSSGYGSASGKMVSPETAMCMSAAFDCVRKNAEVISTMPMALYETGKDGKRVRLENELDEVLTFRPNSGQTAQQFWEGMQAQCELRGNAFAERLFIGPRLVGLRPLLNCTAAINRDGRMEYRVADRGKITVLPPEKVFHMRGFGAGDGLGLSTIKYGAQSMGAALAADESAGKVFANGLQASGVLTTDQKLTAAQRAGLQEVMNDFSGSAKAGKVIVMEAGLDFRQLQMNPEDAQLLDTRQFGVEDVCRWFGTPPIVVGHAGRGQTMWGTGMEQIFISWLKLGVNPRLVRVQNQVAVDLIPREKRRRWVLDFDRESLIQMDAKAKGEFLSRMATSGTMTANERRDRVGLPRDPDPASDKLMMQGAMAPISDLGETT